jgi:superfamily I DNA/RNA helicase
VLKRSGPAALTAEPRVLVGTVHSVKGGEAGTVILSPDLSAQGYWGGWHAGGAGRDAITRMFYVALTRARERAVLLAPSGPEHCHGELRDAIGAGEAVGA